MYVYVNCKNKEINVILPMDPINLVTRASLLVTAIIYIVTVAKFLVLLENKLTMDFTMNFPRTEKFIAIQMLEV